MYKRPIKSLYPIKKPQKAVVPVLSQQPIDVAHFGLELALLRREIENEAQNKIEIFDGYIQSIDERLSKIDSLGKKLALIKNGNPGLPGKAGISPVINYDLIIREVTKNIPIPKNGETPVVDYKKIIDGVVSKIPVPKNVATPEIDYELIISILEKKLPAPKELNPKDVIDQILSLPEGKGLTMKHISGLEQTMNAWKNQLSRGYMHGGGDTVKAGTNITLVRNPDGTTTISAVNSGAVSSVSNANGTITVSPTTGAVIVSLNTAHANTWTAIQTFNASGTYLFESTALGSIIASFNTITGAASIGDINNVYNVGFVQVTGTGFPMILIDGRDQGVTITGGGDGAQIILQGGISINAGDSAGVTIAGGAQGGNWDGSAGDGDAIGSPGGIATLKGGEDAGTGAGYVQINQTGLRTVIGLNVNPNSTLQIGGSFSWPYIAKSANYTLTATDVTVNVTASGKTMTLPTAVGITGRVYIIKATYTTGTGTLNTTSSQTIFTTGAVTSITMNAGDVYVVQSTGANWIQI